MRISNKAYQLVKAKYLAKGKIVSDEGCIAYRETIVKSSNHQYKIYALKKNMMSYILVFMKMITSLNSMR
ncbi:MAG: hypothetical protein MJ191_07530 [Clostridium sp.]|nr:hypothetical protein [Clostridium sp.]